MRQDFVFDREEKVKTGSKKGILTVIGIGPGALDQMTMEAYYAIEESAVVAGGRIRKQGAAWRRTPP